MNSEFVSHDGSPLAMYLALPAGDAPMIIHRAIGERRSILELGSGPGRLTRVLVALGHRVTAVDDGAEMLAHVTGADTVLADLFDLDLRTSFDVVLAASHLVNVPGEVQRNQLLRVCRRHLGAGGKVVVERHAPNWLLTCKASTTTVGPVEMKFDPGRLDGHNRSASMTYTLAGRTWRQDFATEDVDDHKLAAAANEVGLVIDGILDDDQRWIVLTALDLQTHESPTPDS
ncbi:MAG: class I SAM-dependent methyltransferase [Ilumatobacter sp.]|uniref:class I SAM-dependent methyltransferase n=1 Tax=Ilumatobacter sp. TaxID=1967498 RepID=UPI002611002E|nr:class I SAM-dependent methyltransferase [Ilumatobacter sp.]MDJ0771604.1 class I SAM-dependent methyltransferase [Ilumatobacter sp.]